MVARRKKWFHPKADLGGWTKDLTTEERRELALESHERDPLATARALQALANVTRDKETRKVAEADARFFFREYRKEQAEYR